MSKSTNSNDFLAQIQVAEEEAVAKVEKARRKAASDLQTHSKKEGEKTQAALETARVEAKGKLKDRQEVARGRYEGLIKEGEKEASQLKKNIEPKIDKILPQVQTYFVNEIVS